MISGATVMVTLALADLVEQQKLYPYHKDGKYTILFYVGMIIAKY